MSRKIHQISVRLAIMVIVSLLIEVLPPAQLANAQQQPSAPEMVSWTITPSAIQWGKCVQIDWTVTSGTVEAKFYTEGKKEQGRLLFSGFTGSKQYCPVRGDETDGENTHLWVWAYSEAPELTQGKQIEMLTLTPTPVPPEIKSFSVENATPPPWTSVTFNWSVSGENYDSWAIRLFGQDGPIMASGAPGATSASFVPEQGQQGVYFLTLIRGGLPVVWKGPIYVDVAQPTATSTPLSTATPTSSPTPVPPTATPMPTNTSTATPMPTIAPTAPITGSHGVTTTTVSHVVSGTVASCNKLFLPLVQRSRSVADSEANTSSENTGPQSIQSAMCMVPSATIGRLCQKSHTQWAVIGSDGTAEMEYGRKTVCDDQSIDGPVVVTMVSEASYSGNPWGGLVAFVLAAGAFLLPRAVEAVFSSYDGNSTIGSDQFVIANPALTDEWFTGRLTKPTGMFYGDTVQIQQFVSGHVKFYAQQASWPAEARLVKAATVLTVGNNPKNIALIQYLAGQYVVSYLVQTAEATEGELVATGSPASMVQRAWREGIRFENSQKLADPAKYFDKYQSWTAPNADGVNVELYLAAPSNTAKFVVVSSAYAFAGGDQTLDQSLKLWGAIKIGGATAYSIFLANEWYDKEETTQVAGFSYRPAIMPESETNLQELVAALAVYSVNVLQKIDDAQSTALVRVKSKRDNCMKKGHYWDEVHEKCRPTRPIATDPRPRQPQEDEQPEQPDPPDRNFPPVGFPPQDCNSWGHARQTRGPIWCDDVNYNLHTGTRWWWDFLGYVVHSSDPSDNGPRAAFDLHWEKPVEIGGITVQDVCIPLKWDARYQVWYIPTAVEWTGLTSCLKPVGKIDSTQRLFPPRMPLQL